MITNRSLIGHLIVTILLVLINPCWSQRFGSSSNSKRNSLLTLEENNVEKTHNEIVALEDCGMPPTDGSGSIDPRIGGTVPSNVDEWITGCDGRTLEGLVKIERMSMGQKERDIILVAAVGALKTMKNYSAIAEFIENRLMRSSPQSGKSRKMWITVVGAKNGFSGASKSMVTNEFMTFSIGQLMIHTLSVTVMNRCTGSNLVATPGSIDSWTPEPPKDQWTPDQPKNPQGPWTPESAKNQWTPEPPKDQWTPDRGPQGPWTPEPPKNPDTWSVDQSGLGDWNHDPVMVKTTFNDTFNSFVLENLQPAVLSNGLMASKKQEKVCSYLVDKLTNQFEDSIDPKSWMCFSGPQASTSFKAPNNEVQSMKVKMGPMRVRLVKMPKLFKTESEVIAETRLNIDRTMVNTTEMTLPYVTMFIAIGQEAVQKHSTYATIANYIQTTANEKWPLKFHCVVGLDTQYWIYFWFKKPYLINFTIHQLRIIAYSQT